MPEKDRGRATGPRLCRPRRERRRRAGDAGVGGRRARGACRACALPRRLAAVRHRAVGRHRPARLPQRRRRPGRAGRRRIPRPAALALLGQLKALERVAGRRRRRRWGPRELDLDLLVFGRHRIDVERPPEARSNDAERDPAKAARRLEVPHRDAGERLFVLAPLADLAPRLVPPGWPETVETRRRRVAAAEAPEAVRVVGRWAERRGVRLGPAAASCRPRLQSSGPFGRRRRAGADRRRTTMTTIGYAAMLEQFHPTELLDWCAQAEARRLRGRVHGQRALPPVDAAAGPERVRVGVHGRARAADEPSSSGPP